MVSSMVVSAVTEVMEDPASALEQLLEFFEEELRKPGAGTAAALAGAASMLMMPSNSGSGSGSDTGSPPSNFNGPQPGQPGGGSLPTANTPSAVQAQNIFQSLQTGAIAGISVAGIGPLVAVFDLPQTNDNFRATAGIFEELNVQRRSRRGIREQIGSFFKTIQRMVKGMIQIRRYEHTIHIKMINSILIICCCKFLKLQVYPKKTVLLYSTYC